ncbi:MAG TPA: class II aldolase/adducin family protein, partial [Syntrophomonadaceae bacterium]|nr:class II aldolase/adducin family protein [Syntrophomonadaceae bacterium]
SIETPMHAEIYQKRPDVNAIVHVHSHYSTVFAVAHQSIPVVTEETAQVIGSEIEVAPYATCGSPQLAENTVRTLGPHRAVLLANHGLVGVGKNVADALKVCTVAEKTAKIVLYAQQLGDVHSLLPADIAVLNESFQHYGQKKK